MKNLILTFLLAIIYVVGFSQDSYKTIEFESTDGLKITADLYEVNESFPYIILFHQAGFSRGEYRATALKFNELGYNCLAIDQRSGNAVMDIENETVKRAIEQGKRRMYIDAYQDMQAALDFIYNKTENRPVIVLGSSYSASLVFKLANENPSKISKVLAFSPGEYIKGENVGEWLCELKIPVLITSSKSEIKALDLLKENCLKNDNIVHFKPTEEGIHGSRALWKKTPNNKEYWNVTNEFLTQIKH